MVPLKGKETKVGGGIRVLEDPRPTSKNLRDFKVQRSKPVLRDSCVRPIGMSARESTALKLRKSMPVNPALAKSSMQSALNSGKGNVENPGNSRGKLDKPVKVGTGRKPLVDLSNVDRDKSLQQRSRLSSGFKQMKEKAERRTTLQRENTVSSMKNAAEANASSRKPIRETIRRTEATVVKSKVSVNYGMRRKTFSEVTVCGNHGNNSCESSKLMQNQGLKPLRPRLSLATLKVADAKASSRKSSRITVKATQTTSKLKSPVKKHKQIENSATSSISRDKEVEATVKMNHDQHASAIPQGHRDLETSQLDGSHGSNDNVRTVISRPKCRRRRSYTLSLMARSEALGECTGSMKKDELPNIDDSSNPLEVVEYVDDIYQYYWAMEVQYPSLANYMTTQSEITPRMRGILINWLIEVHFKFELMQETLFLMVQLLDRLLSLVPIKKEELQMVGLTSLLLASKYEDFWHPKIDDLISISANLYTRDQMLAMEKFILAKLRFRLNLPTPYVFMIRFLKAAQSDRKLEHLAFYLIELSLMEYEALKFKPSLLCASAIYAARCTLGMTPAWTDLLEKHARYAEPELRHPFFHNILDWECANMILGFQKAATQKPSSFTYEKFLSHDRSSIAELKALDKLPL